MGQTETAMLVIAVVAILGSIAYGIQSIEERKQAKKMKIMKLKNQIRSALNLYKAMPDIFMTSEIHEFMSLFLVKKWKELHAINSTDDSVKAYNNFKQASKNRVVNTQPPQGSKTVYQDEGQVYHALGILKEATNWLADLKTNKLISEQTFNELGWQLKDFFDRVSCDIEVFEAIEIERLHGAKAGFHKYKSALKSLQNLNQSQALDSQIFVIHNHMEKLKEKVRIIEEEAEIERLRLEAIEQDPDRE